MSDRPRLIELDLLRTLAILGMVVYHTAYDLQILYGWDIDVFSGGWKLFQLMIASLFLGLVGVAAALSDNRMNAETYASYVPTWDRAFKRFIRIGAAAGLVTIVTYIIDPETYVRFGILHLIAVSALLIPFFRHPRHPEPVEGRTSLPMTIAIIVIGMGIIAIGSFMNQWHIDDAWRFVGISLGIRPDHFTTVDYFPLIPWFGIILIGYGIGPVCIHWMHETAGRRPASVIAWPGQHSLILYLIHQPIILGILWVILGKPNL